MRARMRKGFTLIELLIVVVILGILAGIVMLNFRNTKGKANATAMKSDLRNLATAQESYFFETGVYTTSAAALTYIRSPGVTVTISAADGAGWAAEATHPQAWPLVCYIFVGNKGPNGPATVEGAIECN
jgi:prepilin-type N-terminal cleavage/methylation domain-containing protein